MRGERCTIPTSTDVNNLIEGAAASLGGGKDNRFLGTPQFDTPFSYKFKLPIARILFGIVT